MRHFNRNRGPDRLLVWIHKRVTFNGYLQLLFLMLTLFYFAAPTHHHLWLSAINKEILSRCYYYHTFLNVMVFIRDLIQILKPYLHLCNDPSCTTHTTGTVNNSSYRTR